MRRSSLLNTEASSLMFYAHQIQLGGKADSSSAGWYEAKVVIVRSECRHATELQQLMYDAKHIPVCGLLV